jgi:hypothetical protein
MGIGTPSEDETITCEECGALLLGDEPGNHHCAFRHSVYPDTVYDKDLKSFRIVRHWNAGKGDGSIIVENGSTRGLMLIPSEFEKRRFTRLYDASGLPIYEGDLLSVGMRLGDENGWTTEVVARRGETGEWALVDQATRTEFMQMQHDYRLRKLTGESIFEVVERQQSEHLTDWVSY